jgi:predicted dehydrogenase
MAFDQELPESLWIGSRDQASQVWRGSDATGAEAQRYARLPAGHPQGYQDCFNAFVADVHATVRGEYAEGLPTFEDGRRAAVITDAVVRAAADQIWVEVPA